MHIECEPYGYLLIDGSSPSMEELSALVGRKADEVVPAYNELLRRGVPGVTEKGHKVGEGVIFSRRMIRDEKRRLDGQKGGLISTGSWTKRPTEPKPKKPKRSSKDLPPIPASLDTEAFQAAWSAWLDFRRKDKRVPVTARAAKMQFKDLEAAGPILAVAAIEQSISNDWQGIFPDKLSKETKLSLRDAQEATFGFSDPRYDETGRYRGVQR
jgi:hypothetical protein